MDLKIFFCIGAKYYKWYTYMMWYLYKWKVIKGVITVEIWRKSVNFLFSTYNYGKTRATIENPMTPSYWAHPSGQRFVNNLRLFWKNVFFFCSPV